MTKSNVSSSTFRAATNELSRHLSRLKQALKDTDPSVTGEAMLWVAALEGVVNFMKDEQNVED